MRFLLFLAWAGSALAALEPGALPSAFRPSGPNCVDVPDWQVHAYNVGIDGGVEWSVGVNDVTPLVAGFDRLWNDHRSVPLTHELLQDYRRRWLATRRTPSDLLQTTIELPSSDREPDATPPGHAVEAEHEAPAEAPTPRAVQRDALDALEQTRLAGHGAGLVVMATGLGKTWLAAFDTSRPQFRRILFIAHREEILRQSRGVFRAVQPDADLGLFNGTEKNQHARIVFASVQTLAGHISAFEPDEFDYVVVDEFHHAAARTYRKVIAHFRPQFLLGLTATPDRLDGADLLALSGDNLVFTCNLIAGIERGDLCTFRYFGIADDVDYTEIPWRSGRFDPDELTNAVATRQRAQHVLDEWRSKGGGPTLGFCVSVRHADFMAAYFRDAGVAAVAVHAQSTSAPRSAAIAELRAGTIEVVFSVDVFNEGLDVPSVSTVLMLRPTESPVVFLQQLGRGLRRSDDKDGLVVIDFIGNHRSFLLGPRTLLAAATDTSPSTKDVVEAMRSGDFRLPEGCFVNFDVELVDIFSRVVRIGAHDALEAFCRTHADETGRRPTAIQAWRAGHNPAAAKRLHGGWFGLLEHLDLLDNDEREAWQQHRDTLVAFETDAVNKSYKLITLRAMLDDGTLRSGTSITQVSWTAHRIVKSDPRLVADTQSSTAMPDPIAVSEPEWRTFWRKWPLAAWSGELRGQPGRCFSIEGDRFVPRFAVSDTLGTTFDELASELVDWRLARYLFNRQPSPSGVIRVRVAQSNGRPILFLDRTRFPSTPSGWTPFTADGEEYEGNFVKIALNVARRPGSSANELPRVLREWFGPSAGQPGTEHVVELVSGDGGWTLRPVGPAVSGDAVVDTAG